MVAVFVRNDDRRDARRIDVECLEAAPDLPGAQSRVD
jgi:hypothetical protein